MYNTKHNSILQPSWNLYCLLETKRFIRFLGICVCVRIVLSNGSEITSFYQQIKSLNNLELKHFNSKLNKNWIYN